MPAPQAPDPWAWLGQFQDEASRRLQDDLTPCQLRRIGRALLAAGDMLDGFGPAKAREDSETCRALGVTLPQELVLRPTRKQALQCQREGLELPATRGEARTLTQKLYAKRGSERRAARAVKPSNDQPRSTPPRYGSALLKPED